MQHLIPVVDQITRHPEHFADAQSSSHAAHVLADATKTLYQIAKKAEPKKTKALDSLLLDGFDQEQIWEQIQLFNLPTLKYIDRQVASLQKKSASSSPLGLQVNGDLDDDKEPARKKYKVSSKESDDLGGNSDGDGDGDGDEMEDDDDDDENASGISGDEDDEGEGEEGDEGEEGEEEADGESRGKERFTLDELDDFAEQELEADEELEELLGRADYDDDEDGRGRKKKRNKNALESSSDEEDEEEEEEGEAEDMNGDIDGDAANTLADGDEDNDDNDTPKSRFESEMSEMRNKIKELEDAAVAPKAWTMVGEASYRDRPTNSLLAEDLFFDYAAKPPPVITQERTASLEDIIKQRIAKGSWDDVIRKKDTAVVHKPTVELDSTKNTEGLAKVYEQQYLKTVHGVETEGVMKQQYAEIESLFKEVTQKLDALSHFHFTPKPVLAEANIKANNVATPALSVEEITPTTAAVTGTTPTLVAPQEVFHAPSAYSLKDKEEMSKTERKAHRRHRKEAAVKKKKESSALNNENGATDISQPSNGKKKTDAIKELKKNKNVTLIDSSAPTQKTSSAKFFGKLQNTENGTNNSSKQGKHTPSSLSSKAFKL